MNLKEMEKRLSPEQIKAANLLIENDFAPKDEKKTHEEIAEEVGVSRRTLYNWRNDVDVVRYMDAQSDMALASSRSKAASQLMRLINGDAQQNGLPSIKALELYYKLSGKLVERSEVINGEEHTPADEIDNMRNKVAEFRKRKSE